MTRRHPCDYTKDFNLLRSSASSKPSSLLRSRPGLVFSLSPKVDSVRVLVKSLGRCNSSGISSCDMLGALENRLVAVEGMVGSG